MRSGSNIGICEYCNRCYKRMEEQVDGSRIINRIGIPAALEQLAEECAELGQAALTLSRAMRRENPTRSTVEELLKMLIEEIGDVRASSIDVLDAGIDLSGTEEVKQRKLHRWCASLGEKKKMIDLEQNNSPIARIIAASDKLSCAANRYLCTQGQGMAGCRRRSGRRVHGASGPAGRKKSERGQRSWYIT